MPKKAGKRKKSRTHAGAIAISNPKHTQDASEERGAVGDDVHADNIPRTIVARSYKVAPCVGELIKDVRKMMGPYTASNLRERSYNRMKDYAAVASQLGISHMLSFSQTKNKNIVMRVARFHQGPTLHFRVPAYSLTKHVRALQRRPYDSAAAFNTPPLVVLNNFGQAQGQESHLKLLRVTLQNLFPSINVNTVRLNECRRVVLFHFKKEDSSVEMRHYAIKAAPVGINRNIKKILQCKIPNLGDLKDVSQLLEGNDGYGAGGYSDSEAEDDETTKVELSERYVGSGNGQSQQSAMKLVELGPRMGLELFKVERGMCEGDILYHKFEAKTPAEAAALKNKAEGARRLKEERRRVQEDNVKRKRAEAEALEAAGEGGNKKPRRGLEAWAKNKKETFAGDSEQEDEEGGVEYSDEEQEQEGGEDYYSDSDADA